MKFSKTLLSIFLLSLVFLTSCRKDSDYTNGSSELPLKLQPRTNYYLINTIEVAMNLAGDWEFVDPLSTVENQIEVIFIDNGDFTSVDEFGFESTVLGTQYFYVTQYDVGGAITWFCFLDSSTGAISTTYGGTQSAHGWTCSNDSCCDKCVAHDSLICTCHDQNDECMQRDPPTSGKCKQDMTSRF